VPAESCRILAVRLRATDPQLLSTSRHINPGIVDVLEEKWDAGSRILASRRRVVTGDPYELRIAAEAAAEVIAMTPDDQAAGVKTVFKQSEGLVRPTIESPVSREISWAVKFK
jgi:hypothetical protein